LLEVLQPNNDRVISDVYLSQQNAEDCRVKRVFDDLTDNSDGDLERRRRYTITTSVHDVVRRSILDPYVGTPFSDDECRHACELLKSAAILYLG
jgi:hypothetical protein